VIRSPPTPAHGRQRVLDAGREEKQRPVRQASRPQRWGTPPVGSGWRCGGRFCRRTVPDRKDRRAAASRR
jgi:hypothetical protein